VQPGVGPLLDINDGLIMPNVALPVLFIMIRSAEEVLKALYGHMTFRFPSPGEPGSHAHPGLIPAAGLNKLSSRGTFSLGGGGRDK